MKTKFYVFIFVMSFACLQIQAQIVDDWYCIQETLYSSNVPEEMVDGITYKVSSNEPLYYDKTFYLPDDNYHHIEFNIPFAREFSINGGHVHFVIDKEDFMFHIYRKHKDIGYFDLKMAFCAALGPTLVQQVYKIGFIRIHFAK